MRIGLIGVESDHAEDFLRLFGRLGRFPGYTVAALWGAQANTTRVRSLAHTFHVPSIAVEPEDMLGKIDAVIVGDRDGRHHAAHALPFLAAGVPVFVDKPLACDTADAERMLDAATASGAPLLSGSALRWQARTQALKSRLAGIGECEIAAYGTWYPDSEYGGAIFYAIHTLELMQELIGIEWSELSAGPGDSPTVRFRSGARSASLQFRPPDAAGASAFGVAVRAPGVSMDQPIPLGIDYMAPVALRIVEMLQTRTSPLTRDELLAPVRLMDEITRLLGTA